MTKTKNELHILSPELLPYLRGTRIIQAASSQSIVTNTLLPTTMPFASIRLGLRLAKWLKKQYT